MKALKSISFLLYMTELFILLSFTALLVFIRLTEGEITIFDIKNFVHYTQSQVENEIAKSAKRWKQSLRHERIVSELPRPAVERIERKKVKKYWDRPVKCVETGQVFDTIRDCCDHLGLSYKSVWNAINNGRSRCGLHFVDARKCAAIPTANTDKR